MITDNMVVTQEKETGRVEAFSDGVFAIAITLLVLNLRVPQPGVTPVDNNLATALWNQWPQYLAFVLSFFTILIMWVNHHKMFNYIKYVDGVFLFLNGFLLLTVTVIPFPTAMLSAYIKSSGADIAAAIYAGTFFLNCLSFYILWLYSSDKRRLLDANADQFVIGAIKRNGLVGLIFYVFAAIVAFISAAASVAICFALAIFFALTGVQKRKMQEHLS